MSLLNSHVVKSSFALVIITLVNLSGGFVQADEKEGTSRSWYQGISGYYSASDGWSTYKEYRTKLEQPLEYSEKDFLKLGIPKIDELARTAKRDYENYEKYSPSILKVGLSLISKRDFCSLGTDGQDSLIKKASESAAKWPEYKDNMSRMGQKYKPAKEFMELSPEKKIELLSDSQGTQRSAVQATRGFYSAIDGWNTYKDYRTRMGQPIEYTEYKYIHLPIEDIDKQARFAKQDYEYFTAYSASMSTVGLTTISKTDFCNLGSDEQKTLVKESSDTSEKWPAYSDKMKKLGDPFLNAKEFMALPEEGRAKLLQFAQGKSRSSWQYISGYYSASDGWTTYKDFISELGLQPKYKESEFINLDIKQIDQLAAHAKHSADIYKRFKTLSSNADKPLPYNPQDIYNKLDLSKLESIYEARTKEWAPRILYIESCKRVGANPNWEVFDSKSTDEQLEASVLAKSKADNWESYKQYCDKLTITPTDDFLRSALLEQDKTIELLKEDLWEQRKETIKEVGTYATEVAITVLAAYVAKKAYDGASPKGASASKSPSPAKSRIDRESFGNQRKDYWKTEASKNPNKYPSDNLNKMKEGNAPIGKDGFPMELHHPTGSPSDKLAPMTRTDHRLGDNYEKNHPWLFDKK